MCNETMWGWKHTYKEESKNTEKGWPKEKIMIVENIKWADEKQSRVIHVKKYYFLNN